MSDKHKTIIFKLDKYNNKQEMFQDIARMVNILVDNDYEVAFRYEDCGCYTLEFNHDRSLDYGTEIAAWISVEDWDTLNQIKNYSPGSELDLEKEM